MKKIISILACLTVVAASLSAQEKVCRFGLTAGTNFSYMQETEVSSNVGWRFGVTLPINLPAHFRVQPSVLFDKQGFTYGPDMLHNGGAVGLQAVRTFALNIPVAVQWGPDLGLVRPYVEVAPYVNFNFNSQYKAEHAEQWQSIESFVANPNVGIGAGLGIDIWNFQISARYNWGLHNFLRKEASSPDKNQVPSLVGKRLDTITLNIAYLF